MGIRTRKLIVCIDSSRLGEMSPVQRKVRILDDITMLPLVSTRWTQDREKAAVIQAFIDMYDNGGHSHRPVDIPLPNDTEELLDHIANLSDEEIEVIRRRLGSWQDAADARAS